MLRSDICSVSLPIVQVVAWLLVIKKLEKLETYHQFWSVEGGTTPVLLRLKSGALNTFCMVPGEGF